MKAMKLLFACALALAIAPSTQLTAQVQTNVPDPVPGAKPVSVEHIKIHGTALVAHVAHDKSMPAAFSFEVSGPCSRSSACFLVGDVANAGPESAGAAA
jgi:hypothetical protein